MNITGLETLVFGVEDIAACSQFLLDYGLVTDSDKANRFVALDGTGVELYAATDASLPPGPNGCQMRKCVMGVSDAATLQAIADELGRDRAVKRLADGSIESVDDSGFAISFHITRRKPLHLLGEVSNAPGSPVQRNPNQLGMLAGRTKIQPRSLSHLVYFVPDVAKAEAFYVNRLGFRVTDRFDGVGPFIQPAGSLDHHSHFLIGAPAFMQGVEHFTFHFSGPTDIMQNGTHFAEAGYQPFWGPGRHVFGSNWFWYFNSPFGCHIEMDADMDLLDNTWVPRVASLGADTSQAFLMRRRDKWFPGPGSSEHGDYAS